MGGNGAEGGREAGMKSVYRIMTALDMARRPCIATLEDGSLAF